MLRKLGFTLLIVLCFTTLSVGQADTLEIPIRTLAWSPLGDQIALAGGLYGCQKDSSTVYGIFLLDTLDSELSSLLIGHKCNVRWLSWDSTGTRLLSSGADNHAIIWDSIIGQLSVAGPSAPFGVGEAAWSYSGDKVANIWLNDSRFEVWNVQDGSSIALIGEVTDDRISTLAWKPDDTQIAVGGATGLPSGAGFVRIIDTQTQATRLQIDTTTPVFSVVWKPDSNLIVLNTTGGEIQVWDLTSNSLIHNFAGDNMQLKWHPFENLLLAGSGGNPSNVNIWDVSSETLVQPFETQDLTPSADWSPYGGRVVYNQQDRIAINTNTRSLDDDTLQIALVAPSLERVIGIAEQCYADATDQTRANAVAPAVIEAVTSETLSGFVVEIEALPADAIPAACAADLIAVAEALMEIK